MLRRGVALRRFLVVIAIIAILFSLVTGALDFVGQAAFLLVTGWGYYLARVVPQVQPSAGEVAVAGVSLAMVTGGVHLFARGLTTAIRPETRWPWRWTLKLVTAGLLLFVAGTAAVGVVHQEARHRRDRLHAQTSTRMRRAQPS